MKSSGELLSLRGIFVVFHIFALDVTGAAAASDGSGNVIGIAVGVSLATSIITTLVTLLVVYLVRRAIPKKSTLKRAEQERSSNASSKSSASSTRPLRSAAYSPVSTTDGTKQNGEVKRMISDFVAKWCTEHSLTEHTAQVLRNNHFTTKQALESLRVEDVPKLGLKSLAQECLLREAIMPKLSTAESSGILRQRSNSEEAMPLSPGSREHDYSGGSSGVFERTQSMDQVDGTVSVGKPLKGTARQKSLGSMEIIEDQGESTIIIRSPTAIVKEGPGLVSHTVQPAQKSNPKNFKGLLSDKGLYELSRMIGAECHHLATLLGIPSPVQEQIQMNHPKNTGQQIYEMLRLWRDTAKGTKEEIKGTLHKALVSTGRTDLAEDLLLEQVEGSREKVAYQSIV